MALLGSRVPASLKLFLLTFAIVDDIGAILVIAVFYAADVQSAFIAAAVGLVAVMIGLRKAGVVWLAPYVILGVGVWLATQASGVHATIAGVALGLLAPAQPLTPAALTREWASDLSDDPDPAELDAMSRLAQTSVSPAERLEYRLHPWTSFVVVPVFALEADDFLGFPKGNIAVIQRGTCTFAVKAANAQEAGALAVVIFNEGQPGRTDVVLGTLGGPVVAIPVVGASFATGEELNATPGVVLHVATSTVSETRTTWNVIAETASGNDDNVVVVGAHLDSVVAGPGINDNGTGSSTILEVALQMEKVKPRNTVRFIWFGAEELGLLGSTHYVSQLTQDQIDDIALNLNFDMIGSPNFVRFVYDGDNSAFPVGPTASEGPPGSGYIEKVFVDYLASRGLASEPTAFDGRSDYGPFIDAGIPAGGLFTGAEEIKTPEQAVVYGGTAGDPYDHCYHEACDTIANVNVTAIDQMSDAVAYSVITFAQNTEGVNGVKGKGNFKPRNIDPVTGPQAAA